MKTPEEYEAEIRSLKEKVNDWVELVNQVEADIGGQSLLAMFRRPQTEEHVALVKAAERINNFCMEYMEAHGVDSCLEVV